MGYLLRCKCEKCEYDQQVALGNGIRDCQLAYVLDSLEGDFRRCIEGRLAQGAHCTQWSMSRQLGRCSLCGKLESVPVFCLTGEEESEVIMPACSCGGRYNVVCIKEDKDVCVTCPTCGSAIKVQQVGLWD